MQTKSVSNSSYQMYISLQNLNLNSAIDSFIIVEKVWKMSLCVYKK